MKKVLIVGGGLAGVSVAQRLKQRKVAFKLIDSQEQKSSSEIATGMYNPVVFRRINKSWMIDDLLPELRTFYKSIEEELNASYIKEIQFAKRIPSDDYHLLWDRKASDTEFESYLNPIKDGLGFVRNAGMLDCNSLLRDYKSQLAQANILIDSTINQDSIHLEDGQPHYLDEEFDHVIYCEGAHAIQNPLWNWLPFNICKGEWVIIKTEEEVSEFVLNNVLNIIPLGNHLYKLSSTYRWNDLSWDSTIGAKDELLSAFTSLFDVDYQIIDQQAGLRPTVADRRPYLGKHPDYPKLSIFNGLGSKGVMLAPWFSKHLIDHLLDGDSLMPEVDISRHIKRYRNRIDS